MRNVVFLHKRTLYFAVASRKGCVDFSIIVDGKYCRKAVASRKGCVDLSLIQKVIVRFIYRRIPQGMRGF